LHLLSADNNLRLNHPIADITTDFDGDLRDATNPYAGADEYISSLAFDVMNRCALQLAKFTLNNTSNISNTKWHFGDSQTSVELSPTHTYTIAGTYNVSVDITYPTSTQTITKTININPSPLKLEIKHE